MFSYIALLLAQAGTSFKQFAMKRCGKIAPGPFNSICINMMRALICLVISVIIWLATGGGVTTPTGHLIIIISGIGTAFNLFTWILSTRIVSLTLLESTCMIGTLVLPLILAPYLYNGESVSLLQWIGCILVFVSVFLFAKKNGNDTTEGGIFKKAAVVFVCAASITLSSILKKYYTYHIVGNGLGSIEYFTLINFVTVVVVFSILFAIYYIREKKSLSPVDKENAKVELPYKKVWIYVLIAASALYVNELFTVYATKLPSAIYYPLSKGLVIGCTFLLDVIVFKEKVTIKKLIGLATVICAIVLVNI